MVLYDVMPPLDSRLLYEIAPGLQSMNDSGGILINDNNVALRATLCHLQNTSDARHGSLQSHLAHAPTLSLVIASLQCDVLQ